jgi:predicted nucleic acid-binding protein
LRFWDSSAVVALIVAEGSTATMQAVAAEDPVMCVWWGTEIECVSAVARLEREESLAAAATVEALSRLDLLAGAWSEVQPVAAVRVAARRMLRVHPLRAADALQLAAAVVAAEGVPASLELVTLDDRLAGAARREGFSVHGDGESLSLG